jgi:hypothetical protein
MYANFRSQDEEGNKQGTNRLNIHEPQKSVQTGVGID